MEFRRTIKVKNQFIALHCWDNIPADHPSQFLKHPHRHVFHVLTELELLSDDNREVEFFVLQKSIQRFLDDKFTGGTLRLSCEAMAEMIATQVSWYFPNRNIEVEVSEDGENAGKVYLQK